MLFSIKKHIQDVAGSDVNIIEGIGVEDGMDDEISVTVIATGFKVNKNLGPAKPQTPKVYDLENDETVVDEAIDEEVSDSSEVFDTGETPQATLNFELDVEAPTLNFSLEEETSEESPIDFPIQNEISHLQKEVISEAIEEDNIDENEVVVHTLEMEQEAEEVITELKDEVEKGEFTQINHGISAEQMALRSRQRMDRLREITMKLRTPSGLTDLESEPAYKRREVELDDVAHSSESEASNYVLGEDDDKNIGIKPNNFLHDNVD